MLDAVNYRAIEKLRDGRNYIIRAQRRDDNIIDALHQRAGLRSFYLRFLTRKHRLKNFEAAFYLNVDFIRQVALLAELHGEIIGGARYYIWSPGQADIAFIVGDAYQNKGIASVMLRHLAFIARDADISDLHAHTLPDNRRALRVLDKLGFRCTVARKRNMMHVTMRSRHLLQPWAPRPSPRLTTLLARLKRRTRRTGRRPLPSSSRRCLKFLQLSKCPRSRHLLQPWQ